MSPQFRRVYASAPIIHVDPFNNIPYPTAVLTSLVSGASFARFDPSGKFIAGGRPDGSAVVWDLDTKSAIRWLEGHVKAVTSVECVGSFDFSESSDSYVLVTSWSRNSRFVLTSSKDWNVIIWDLASNCDPPLRYSTVRFDAPVVSAAFHPRNMYVSTYTLERCSLNPLKADDPHSFVHRRGVHR